MIFDFFSAIAGLLGMHNRSPRRARQTHPRPRAEHVPVVTRNRLANNRTDSAATFGELIISPK